MLVIGGRSGAEYLADVWALSLAESPVWSLLTPSGSPPGGRGFHSVIYDPVRDLVVLFGGTGHSGPRTDTWALSLDPGPAWSQIPASGPTARYAHAAFHDPSNDRMVVLGGSDGGAMYDDVWALPLAPGAEWTQLSPEGARPSPRTSLAAIYDATQQRIVLFGGRGFAGNDNETWSLVNPSVGVGTPAPAPAMRLAAAQPNPSRADVEIAYALPGASLATLRVYDVSGRAVRTLLDGTLPAGTGRIRWDRRASTGELVLPGVYFCELRVADQRLTKRMVLIP
jgi:hypothetical protein